MTKSLVGLLLTAAVSAACGGSNLSTGGGGGAAPGAASMPPMPVDMVTLEAKPVEQSTEFVGTVKSRQSINVQPQVEGYLTRIVVKSGARVNKGAVLMEIDARTQQAQVSSLESVRTQREIDLQYARQESDRQSKLLAAGAASQMDSDRATNAVKAAEAQLRTAEEQIRALRSDLAYYRVTAPQAGIVGDIPVHEGDRVTKATLLTTVDANTGLELYLNVPVQQAPQLRAGLPVKLLDESGQPVTTAAINFISPSVDTTTQTVLAKVPLPPNGPFRTDQFVRSQVIWSTAPGLNVPVTAVTRINGQYFAFVAEPGEGGKLVAHQRAVTLGQVVGNEYLVLGGLKPGEKLIVGGIQKIRDGAPVVAAAAGGGAAGGGAPAGSGEGRGGR